MCFCLYPPLDRARHLCWCRYNPHWIFSKCFFLSRQKHPTSTRELWVGVTSFLFFLHIQLFKHFLSSIWLLILIFFTSGLSLADDLHAAVHYEAQSQVVCVHWRVRKPSIFPHINLWLQDSHLFWFLFTLTCLSVTADWSSIAPPTAATTHSSQSVSPATPGSLMMSHTGPWTCPSQSAKVDDVETVKVLLRYSCVFACRSVLQCGDSHQDACREVDLQFWRAALRPTGTQWLPTLPKEGVQWWGCSDSEKRSKISFSSV